MPCRFEFRNVKKTYTFIQKNKLNSEFYINLVALLPRYALSLTVGINKQDSLVDSAVASIIFDTCCNFLSPIGLLYMSIDLQVG